MFVMSALPGAAQDTEHGFELGVTPPETKAGKSVEVASITPCLDKDPGLVTEVDIQVFYAQELVAGETFTAFSPNDPSLDGSWSWTYRVPAADSAGVHTVVAYCWALEPDPDSSKPSRRLVGDYNKADILAELDSEVHDSRPTGPPRPNPAAPPIGSGYAEMEEASASSSLSDAPVPAPPPATAVLARPNFAG